MNEERIKELELKIKEERLKQELLKLRWENQARTVMAGSKLVADITTLGILGGVDVWGSKKPDTKRVDK